MVDGSPPLQISSPVVLIAPALNALYTVTTTSSVSVHPLLPVTVTVYVVVDDGFALGSSVVASSKSVVGLHE